MLSRGAIRRGRLTRLRLDVAERRRPMILRGTALTNRRMCAAVQRAFTRNLWRVGATGIDPFVFRVVAPEIKVDLSLAGLGRSMRAAPARVSSQLVRGPSALVHLCLGPVPSQARVRERLGKIGGRGLARKLDLAGDSSMMLGRLVSPGGRCRSTLVRFRGRSMADMGVSVRFVDGFGGRNTTMQTADSMRTTLVLLWAMVVRRSCRRIVRGIAVRTTIAMRQRRTF